MSAAITIDEEELAEMVAMRVAELLTPERIEAIAAAHIDARIRRLTLAEAMPRLGCSNERQLKDKCRALGIPLYKELGQKSPYILLADIEAKNTRRSVIVPLVASTNGTRIGKVGLWDGKWKMENGKESPGRTGTESEAKAS